jgi:hypothetical protein
MQLHYRGVPYEYYPSTLPTQETDHLGVYRGHPFKIGQPAVSFRVDPTVDLTYRGVAYHPTKAQGLQPGPDSAIAAPTHPELLEPAWILQESIQIFSLQVKR